MRVAIGPSVSLLVTGAALAAALTAALTGALPASATEQRPPPVVVSGVPTPPPSSDDTSTSTPATSTTAAPYRPLNPSNMLDTPLQARPDTVAGPDLPQLGVHTEPTPVEHHAPPLGDTHGDAAVVGGASAGPAAPVAPGVAAVVGPDVGARAAVDTVVVERSAAAMPMVLRPAKHRPAGPVVGMTDRTPANGSALGFAALLAGATVLVLWRSRPRRQDASAT